MTRPFPRLADYFAAFTLCRHVVLALPPLLLFTLSSTEAETWDLPQPVTDANVSINFKIDSTWKMIEASTTQLHGTIGLRDPNDPLSVRADVALPVGLFRTKDSDDDERIRESMDVENYPTVRFVSHRLSQSCAPKEIEKSGSCKGTLTGRLTIRDVTQVVFLPIEIIRREDTYILRGSHAIEWASYNVHDPSVFIARVDPIATIFYECVIPVRESKANGERP